MSGKTVHCHLNSLLEFGQPVKNRKPNGYFIKKSERMESEMKTKKDSVIQHGVDLMQNIISHF